MTSQDDTISKSLATPTEFRVSRRELTAHRQIVGRIGDVGHWTKPNRLRHCRTNVHDDSRHYHTL